MFIMPNHVRLIAVPESADGPRRAPGEAHRRYTRMVNFRDRLRGHLWQGRFASFVLDEPYLLTAARYVELNLVRAVLVDAPSQYGWSSAPAHVRGRDDELARVALLLKLAPPLPRLCDEYPSPRTILWCWDTGADRRRCTSNWRNDETSKNSKRMARNRNAGKRRQPGSDDRRAAPGSISG
jgi:hypothetical protein